MILPGLRCPCGCPDLAAVDPGDAPVYAELRPFAGLPGVSQRVGKRQGVRIALHPGRPATGRCMARLAGQAVTAELEVAGA